MLAMDDISLFFFFFQAEDGIRDRDVTGVQTCALPIFGRVTKMVICSAGLSPASILMRIRGKLTRGNSATGRRRAATAPPTISAARSEERRVGKECRWRWAGGS